MPTKKAEDAIVWIRQRDTGAIRSVPAAEWRKDKKTLEAHGYELCAEDGSPMVDE